MTSTKSHHDQLIALARQDGWIPGFGWRAGLRRAAGVILVLALLVVCVGMGWV